MLRLSCPKCNAWCEAPDVGLLQQVLEIHRGACPGHARNEGAAAPCNEAVVPARPFRRKQGAQSHTNMLKKLIRESLPRLAEDPERQRLLNTSLEELMDGINDVIATEEGQHLFEAANQFADQMGAELTSVEKLKTVVIFLWNLVGKLTSKPKIRRGVFISLLGLLVTIAPVVLVESAAVWLTMYLLYIGRGIVMCGMYLLVNGFNEFLMQIGAADIPLLAEALL